MERSRRGPSFYKLGDFVRSLFAGNRDRMEKARILGLWQKAVGETIAAKARAYDLRGRVLYVAVADKMWQSELSFMKGKILSKFKDEYSVQLTDIYLKYQKLKPLPELPQKKKEEHIDLKDIEVEPLDPGVKDPDLRLVLKSFNETARKAAIWRKEHPETAETGISPEPREEKGIREIDHFYPQYGIRSNFLAQKDEFQDFRD